MLKSSWKKVALCKSFRERPGSGAERTLQVESVMPETIRPGDLIVFCSHKANACQRVLFEKSADSMPWFFVKADNAFDSEGWIPAYRIVGRVRRINGVSTRYWKMRWRAQFMLHHSRLQWWVYERLLASILQRPGRFEAKPLWLSLFEALSSPWRLFSDSLWTSHFRWTYLTSAS